MAALTVTPSMLGTAGLVLDGVELQTSQRGEVVMHSSRQARYDARPWSKGLNTPVQACTLAAKVHSDGLVLSTLTIVDEI